MSTYVRFRTAAGAYAVPVEAVLGVRDAKGLRPLPDPRPGIVGVLPDADGTLPVTGVLGAGQDAVVVVRGPGGVALGVAVAAVDGLGTLGPLGPAPAGQASRVVTGSATAGAELLLVVDPAALVSEALLDEVADQLGDGSPP